MKEEIERKKRWGMRKLREEIVEGGKEIVEREKSREGDRRK